MILRDYQIDLSNKAVELLKSHKIAYLSMQVRTGKTITSLETAKKYGASIVLFVTKKKAISSIEKDYMSMYGGSFVMYCVNFESMHKLPDVKFDLVIIDEAHSLGQFPTPSKRTKSLKQICAGLPIIFLSGTPSPEGYSQLFHQFWVSSFSPFGASNFYSWVKAGFVSVSVRYVFNRQLNDYSNANKELIDKYCSNLFLSYSQEEAGFEQLVEEKVHIVTMSDKTYNICKQLRAKRVLIGKDGGVIEADTEVKLMQKLHQIYSGTVIFDNDFKPMQIDDSKAVYIFDTFKGQKIAIYYKFKCELFLIKLEAAKYGLKITDCPEEFNANDGIIFVSQIQAGREGVNLSTADCLVMYNIDFAAVSYWQVRARLQTKERTKTAMVHWIFAKEGIEPRIYNAVSNKKDYTLNYFKRDENY